MIRCKVCKEDTTHNKQSSMHGLVHRYGPVGHEFVPEAVPQLTCLDCDVLAKER
jgi:hypothetical protein